MKSLLLMSAFALAAPAMAQTAAAPATTPPASTNDAQPAAAPQPATDAPAATSTPSATATPSAAATPAAPANPADAVATVVSNDWAKYDADSNSNLSKTEFAAWMTALRESNPAQKAQVTDVEAWTTAAFAQADKDKSGAVSKDELQGFLKG